jgi:hypothetical protein
MTSDFAERMQSCVDSTEGEPYIEWNLERATVGMAWREPGVPGRCHFKIFALLSNGAPGNLIENGTQAAGR